jgi:hypothetical protein
MQDEIGADYSRETRIDGRYVIWPRRQVAPKMAAV